MNLKIVQCLFFSIIPIFSFTQTNVDSLEAVIKSDATIKEKTEANFFLSRHYVYDDTPKAIELARAGLELAKKCDCADTEYPLLNILAWSEAEMYHWEAAIEGANLILKGVENGRFKAKDAKSEAYRILGYVYFRKMDYEKCLETYQLGLEEAERVGDQSGIGGAYCNIAMIYHVQDDVETARKYYASAIESLQTEGEENFLANTFSNLAAITEDFSERERLVDSAFAIYQKIGQSEYAASSLVDKGNIYFDQKQYEKALKTYQESLVGIDNNILQWYYSYAKIGKAFLELEQFDSAIFYGKMALDTIKFYEGSPFVQQELFYTLTMANLRLGNLAAVEKNYLEGLEIADTIYSKENKEQQAKFDAQFENTKNQAQIAEQQLQIAQQTNTRNKILIGGGLLFLIAALLFQRFYYRQKRKKQEAESALLAEKQEAEKLRELNRLKSTFFTNISHELRTPLTLVAAPLDDALREVKPSPLRNQLQLAHSNTQKLLRLVNEILDLSKLEAGKIETKLSETHLLQTLRRIFYSFESIAQIRGLQLQFNTNISKNLKVFLDTDKFEKILNNLLSNAVKFTKKGGTIALNARHEKGTFLFKVSDTGMGISEEELPKIFDRFYQSTNENAKVQGGTGIGLSLAKELANLMQGDLEVSSQLGKGSQFKLNLPLKLVTIQQEISEELRYEEIVVEQNSVEAKPSYQPLLLNGQKPKILVIEDNEEMNQYLTEKLSKNYQISKAFDGLQALEKMKKENFDLITCDVMMPNLDGFAFREQLLEREDWRQIPFVMLTARSMEADKLKGLRLGVDDYLTKPFNIRELQARLHNLLSNKIARESFKEEAKEIKEKPLSHDEQLIKTAEAFVLKRIDDTQLRVDHLAKELNLSARHLSRTMSKIIGISPVNFILEIRLQKARQLLESRQFLTVSEVRYEIGIESASYFTKKFTERFGKNPKEYLD